MLNRGGSIPACGSFVYCRAFTTGDVPCFIVIENPMRTKLKSIDQIRKTFQGVFEREGKKVNWNGYSEPTLLLYHIKDEAGTVVADHLWFSMTKAFEALGTLQKGDVIEFEARVSVYRKGYVNRAMNMSKRSTDYKLSRPTKVRLISKKNE